MDKKIPSNHGKFRTHILFRFLVFTKDYVIIYWKEKGTHIHFECFLYKRYILFVNESVFEILNIHIWTHCDTFHCKQTSVCRALMVKATEVTQMRHKPYATIESTGFSNAIFLIIWYKLRLLNENINMAHENYATWEF